jgi:hypothetical protein
VKIAVGLLGFPTASQISEIINYFGFRKLGGPIAFGPVARLHIVVGSTWGWNKVFISC